MRRPGVVIRDWGWDWDWGWGLGLGVQKLGLRQVIKARAGLNGLGSVYRKDLKKYLPGFWDGISRLGLKARA